MKGIYLILSVLFFASCRYKDSTVEYRIKQVNFSSVTLKDNFWKNRLDTNRTVTIPYGFKMCESTGRIDNFKIAGGLKGGKFCTKFPFDDSDVYKIIEGAPCYEIKGKDLDEIPLMKYCEKDGGEYISSGIVVSRDPENKRLNASFHRMMKI